MALLKSIRYLMRKLLTEATDSLEGIVDRASASVISW